MFVVLDDPKLAARVHAFLSRYGLVNFGVYKILKMPPPCKSEIVMYYTFYRNENYVSVETSWVSAKFYSCCWTAPVDNACSWNYTLWSDCAISSLLSIVCNTVELLMCVPCTFANYTVKFNLCCVMFKGCRQCFWSWLTQ